MTVQDLVRQMIKDNGFTHSDFATKMGYRSSGSVGNSLAGRSLRVDTLSKFLNALGANLIIQEGDRYWSVEGSDVKEITIKEPGFSAEIGDAEDIVIQRLLAKVENVLRG